jgi:hypothetical protein
MPASINPIVEFGHFVLREEIIIMSCELMISMELWVELENVQICGRLFFFIVGLRNL